MNPNTVVTLYATDFDISNRYVVKAESEGEALGVVSSYPNKVYPDCYWQRDASAFRATGNINDVKKYNYCTFENNGKLNFAFITDFTYINDDMTLCHVEIDPWLNYAGQYVFNDSPMKRCHPERDTLGNNILSEPVQVDGWNYTLVERGKASDDSSYVYLVTAINPRKYEVGSLVNEFWDGLYQLFNEKQPSSLKSWSDAYDGSNAMTGVGDSAQPQPCTSAGNADSIGEVITALCQNGKESSIIACYHIPMYFLNGEAAAGIPVSTGLPSKRFDEDLPLTWGGVTIHWNKIKASPQFNTVIMNITGNSKEVPYDLIKTDAIQAGTLKFEITTNQGLNGCATCSPNDLKRGDNGKGIFSISSKQWDKIQYGVNALDYLGVLKPIMGMASGLLTGILGIGGASVVGNMSLGRLGSIMGSAEQMVHSGMQLEQTLQNTGKTIGSSNASTIASYNDTAGLLILEHTFPSSIAIAKIESFFGTYGYNQGNMVRPIIFGNYPHWNYYETQEASITGKSVPQKDLIKIIQRFNTGIFIFNSVADYKDFSKSSSNHL